MRFAALRRWLGFGVAVAIALSAAAAAAQTMQIRPADVANLIKQGRAAQAYRNWRPLAEGGDAGAQYGLGLLLFADAQQGIGLPASAKQDSAKVWLERAALQNHPLANYNLAQLHLRGIATPKDPAQAIHWLQRAGLLGIADAFAAIAQIEVKKAAGGRDIIAAEGWLRLSYRLGSETGQKAWIRIHRARRLAEHRQTWMRYGQAKKAQDRNAMKQIADRHKETDNPFLQWLLFDYELTRRNKKGWAKWLQRAAIGGNPDAMTQLMKGLCENCPIEKPNEQSFPWLRRLATFGYNNTGSALAVAYLEGAGIGASKTMGLAWLRREMGRRSAGAGELLRRFSPAEAARIQTQLDEDRAAALKALSDGTIPEARTRPLYLGTGTTPPDEMPDLANAGDPLAQDWHARGLAAADKPKEAFGWFRLAAAQGLVESQIELARLYRQGIGVESDPKQALLWLTHAALQGERAALLRRERWLATSDPGLRGAVENEVRDWRPSAP